MQVHGKFGQHYIDVEYDETSNKRMGIHPALYLLGKGTSVKFERVYEDTKTRMNQAARTIGRICQGKLARVLLQMMKAAEIAKNMLGQ